MIEILARGYSHWSMYLLGGFCFVIVGLINELVSWDMLFQYQCLLGGTIITVLEFIVGLIVNVWLKWGIWDYSALPLNIMGQICLPFTLIWIVLSSAIIVVDDLVRYKVFKEEKPHYTSLTLNKLRGDKNEKEN